MYTVQLINVNTKKIINEFSYEEYSPLVEMMLENEKDNSKSYVSHKVLNENSKTIYKIYYDV